MTSPNRNNHAGLNWVHIGLGAVSLAGGCGTSGFAARPSAVDKRDEVVVGRGSSRLVAAGPARLLHVEVAGGGNLSLYRVVLNDGGDGDVACRSGAPIQPIVLRGERDNRLNLDVDAGQAACLIADASARDRGVPARWHLQQPAQPASPAFGDRTSASDEVVMMGSLDSRSTE